MILVILDDYSHYVWTFPLRGKSDALSTLTDFYSYVSTQFGRPILTLPIDNGKEFDNLVVRIFLSHHGKLFVSHARILHSRTVEPNASFAL